MVIQLDEENKNAVLSLRQTEILAKLQPLTSEIDANTDSSYVCSLIELFLEPHPVWKNFRPHIPSGVWQIHARVYSWLTLLWLHSRSSLG